MKLSHTLLAAAGALVVACGLGPDENRPDPLACIVPADEIFSGGVSRDGIPALTLPEVVPAGDASFMSDDDRVLGLEVNGEPRAYPFSVLWWHEVVNDTLGGESVLVTYCPLTGSGIAFDARVDGGQPRNFGVSGLLWRSNLIMFDRSTETLWNQMFLQGTCGVDRGKDLSRHAIIETTWGHWESLHPNTTVMTQNTGFTDRPYGAYPYGNYADPNNFLIDFLPRGTTISPDRPPKELVLGISHSGSATAYPFGVLEETGIANNDVVGDLPVLVTYLAAEQTATAFERRVDGQELTFTVADPDALTLEDEETGSVWSITGEAISGPLAGEQLTQLVDAYVVFWFAWSVYFRNTDIF